MWHVPSIMTPYPFRTPLHMACFCHDGDLSCIMLLVSRGADVTRCDGHNRTPLIFACMSAPTTITTTSSSAASTSTSSPSHTNWTCLVEYLLLMFDGVRQGINHQDHKGRTALWYAADNRHDSGVTWLLEGGADPYQSDVYGVSPMTMRTCTRKSRILTKSTKQSLEVSDGTMNEVGGGDGVIATD